LPSKEELIVRGCHAEFKAAVYRNTPAELFIESNHRQATRIAQLSRKPVFCYETREMVYHATIEQLRVRESIRRSPRRLWVGLPGQPGRLFALYGHCLVGDLAKRVMYEYT